VVDRGVLDDKGNVTVYEYKQENPEGVGRSLPQEKIRLANESASQTVPPSA
jgi:hypothetical protein